ncbi:MAG: hypothetical protein PHO02_01890 [Candidatus Nanoarchaeia archaeon]|nr:hypothetical protein [Candidatus Nanoarchaeia archaeon]
MADGLFGLFKKQKKSKEEIEKEKKEKANEELEKAYKENPLIQYKPLAPKFAKDKYELVVESMGSGLEKYYFWVLKFMREPFPSGLGFDNVEKIRDLFDASVTSSFHGHVGSKMSAMQQQAQQYLALIAQLVKTLFPIVRELRISDERLQYYEDSLKGNESAEIALKSIWVEMVEKGMENPNSVYGLSTKVGFLSLPDLFFSMNPKDGLKGVDAAIKSAKQNGVNDKVANVLAKKLYSYYDWKDKTYKEMQHTRQFKVSYLRQHYNSIRLYMNWVRPYLQNIRQLQMKGNMNDADIVNAFETSKIYVELMAQKKGGYESKKEGFTAYYPVVLVKMTHVTRPDLTYTPQGQKQPTHVGKVQVEISSYAVTQPQIEAYKGNKDQEDVELLASVDATMMAIKDDLKKYLGDMGEKFAEDKKKEEKKLDDSIIGIFKDLFSGFKDIFMLFKPEKKGEGFFSSKSKKTAKEEEEQKEKAKKYAVDMAAIMYDVFKKVNRMYSTV